MWTVDSQRVPGQNMPVNEYLQRWSHLKDIDFPQLNGWHSGGSPD